MVKTKTRCKIIHVLSQNLSLVPRVAEKQHYTALMKTMQSMVIWAASWKKPTKWHVRPAKTQISLGIRPVWLVFAVRSMISKAFLMRTAKTDQTGRMPRLIWVFAGRTVILLVLSCRGSFDNTVKIRCCCNLNKLHEELNRNQFYSRVKDNE